MWLSRDLDEDVTDWGVLCAPARESVPVTSSPFLVRVTAAAGGDTQPVTMPAAARYPTVSRDRPRGPARGGDRRHGLGGGGREDAAEAAQLALGKVLFANGYAMYVFTADRGSTSHCYGDCAHAWPPLIAEGEIVAGRGSSAASSRPPTRDDGSRQITYAGRPLYGYIGDPRGEVYCQNVEEYGGVWYAVKPSGKPVSSG